MPDWIEGKEAARNKLVSWFSNFVSWQGATNAHSLSSVIEERRRQGAKGQTKWVSYFLPPPKAYQLHDHIVETLHDHVITKEAMEEWQ